MPLFPPPPDPVPIATPMASRGSEGVECLSQAVYYEARGESVAGQEAVARVVLNRLAKPSFPKSVCGVVYQRLAAGGCQFSFVCDGAMGRPIEPAAWGRAMIIAERALAGQGGQGGAMVGRASSFHAVRLGDIWGSRMIQIAQIGRHDFYSPARRSGPQGRAAGSILAAAATPPPIRYTFALGRLVRVSDGAPAEDTTAPADGDSAAP